MTAAATLGQTGERIDLEIRAGFTFGPVEVDLQNDDGTPYDFSGGTPRVRLKDRSTGAYTDMAVANADGAAGYFEFSMSSSATGALSRPQKATSPPVAYDWFCYIEFAGREMPVYYGEARVFGGIA